jgi:hypothetical protein
MKRENGHFGTDSSGVAFSYKQLLTHIKNPLRQIGFAQGILYV